jgi:PAS domain S-box-containing protein
MVNLPPVSPLAEIRDRALQATDVSIVVTDASRAGSPVVWVNDAFTRTTGYTADEIVGSSPSVLQGPGTDQETARRIGQAVRAEQATTATVLNYRKDGRPFWNQVSVSPVRDESGRVTHWVGIQVDVTAQVEHSDAQQLSIEAERRARTGLALVSRVSDIISDLDNPYVLREIAALLRREIVQWAGFFVDDDGLRPADGIDASLHPRTPTRRTRLVPDADAAPRARDVVQELLDGAVEGPIELALHGGPAGPATASLAARITAQAGAEVRVAVVHAVQGRRGTLGLLATVSRGDEGLAGLDDNGRTVLHLVVRRVGLAVDNVRLYAREHRLAETLQRAMLPEQAEVDDLDVWTYYAPSSGHAQVGGDWYDVLQVSQSVVAVVIGDVVGHDVEAAAAMGQLRSVVRAYAFESSAPGAVLDRVDQLVAGMRIPRSASLVLATLERHSGGWTLRYSRAGHLPPLVIRDGATIVLDGAAGSLIGFGDGGRGTATLDLVPRDVLVLYTDGLIERRTRSLRDGLAALREIGATGGSSDAAGVGEELLSRLAEAPEDDVAVVVVRIPDPDREPTGHGAPRRRRWSLPSEPSSIGRARHAVVRTCAAWGIPGASSAELVASELVANAVMHGWGHVVLRLFDTGDGLRIEVEDANPAPPVTTDGHPGRIGGYGMRIVERLGDWGWRPSGDGKLVWARVRPRGFGGGDTVSRA